MDEVRLTSRDCGHATDGERRDPHASRGAAAGPQPATGCGDPGRAVVTVVLADDSDAYRRGMARAIDADTRLSLVAEVADGAAALAAIRRLQPDAALLDLQMPALDGVEVCRRVRADRPPRRPRLVLVSASLRDDTALHAHASGMDHELDKTTPRRQICDLLAGAATDGAARSAPAAPSATTPTTKSTGST